MKHKRKLSTVKDLSAEYIILGLLGLYIQNTQSGYSRHLKIFKRSFAYMCKCAEYIFRKS